MRKSIIAGNWKMNKTIAESLSFINDVENLLLNVSNEIKSRAEKFSGKKDIIWHWIDSISYNELNLLHNTQNSEYSCAVKPPIRQAGNRLSGPAGTAYTSLLA